MSLLGIRGGIKSIHYFSHTYVGSGDENVDITAAGVTDVTKTEVKISGSGGSTSSKCELTSTTNVVVSATASVEHTIIVIQHY